MLGIDGEVFSAALEDAKQVKGVATDVELGAEDLQALVAKFKAVIQEHTGSEFPQHPREQLDLAVRGGLRLLEHRSGTLVPPA